MPGLRPPRLDLLKPFIFSVKRRPEREKVSLFFNYLGFNTKIRIEDGSDSPAARALLPRES
jgi:hypothetical protein